MGKLLAFVAGAIVGGVAVGWYFKTHALELTAQGIVDKIAGEGSTAGKVVGGLAHTIEGLG